MSAPERGRVALRERRAGARQLRARKLQIATRANDAFLARHQDWSDRYGDVARTRGTEDAAYHLEFLAGALETGEAAVFVDYVAWLLEVLGSRGIRSESVVESLELVGHGALLLLDGDARESLQEMLDAGVARARAGTTPAAGADQPTDESPLANASRAFLHALLQGERQGALGIAREALRVAAHPTDVYVELFQRSLTEIGRQWQLNRITVAQEHMATAIVQFVLAQLYSALDRSAPTRGSALITGVEGELHQVGANLVADALELDGWRVHFLGTNVPHDGIVEAAAAMKADVVGISATMIFNLDPVARLVESVRGMKGAAPHILVGGGAFRTAPNLWKDVGADGSASDVRGACAIARAVQR
ncbi:MAG: cobalamin B12-binding domain protein [Gemmatimonadetes bacterium]|nr:cobalamin B12-binding domain protein [Gemmatimonadota bacterium]